MVRGKSLEFRMLRWLSLMLNGFNRFNGFNNCLEGFGLCGFLLFSVVFCWIKLICAVCFRFRLDTAECGGKVRDKPARGLLGDMQGITWYCSQGLTPSAFLVLHPDGRKFLENLIRKLSKTLLINFLRILLKIFFQFLAKRHPNKKTLVFYKVSASSVVIHFLWLGTKSAFLPNNSLKNSPKKALFCPFSKTVR